MHAHLALQKQTLDNLELSPTDIAGGWGSGLLGRAADIALAVTGRRIVLDHLSGDGIETLSERLA
jgi:hypothetical protein